MEGYTWHGFSISLNANNKGFSDVRASFRLGIFKTKIKRKDIPSVNNGIAGNQENR